MFDPTPPIQEAMKLVNVMEDAEILVIAVGGAKTVNDAEVVENPFVKETVRGHEVSCDNPVKVAIPVPEELGVTEPIPIIV